MNSGLLEDLGPTNGHLHIISNSSIAVGAEHASIIYNIDWNISRVFIQENTS